MVSFLLLLTVALFAPLLSYEINEKGKVSCHCVPANFCGDNDAAVNGQGLLDIRSHRKICENYYEVCCENTIPEKNLPDQYSIYGGCGSPSQVGVIPRITSDSKNAGFAAHPWMIAVLVGDIDGTDRIMYKCGGSLIHPQIVLTAAHCVYFMKPNILTVRAGEWNTKSQEEPLPHQDRSVVEILTHPNYNNGSLRNDVALMFLIEPFILTPNTGIICLPPPNFQLLAATCTVSGWGKDLLKKGKHSTILKEVDLPLIPKDQCVNALRNTRLGPLYKLHKSFICAGGEKNRDACKGDGGSPLVCPIPGMELKYLQLGIVSWGIGCGDPDVPGVYVNVPLFSKWIDDELNARSLETSFYKY